VGTRTEAGAAVAAGACCGTLNSMTRAVVGGGEVGRVGCGSSVAESFIPSLEVGPVKVLAAEVVLVEELVSFLFLTSQSAVESRRPPI